jgi:hypothetical protein
MAEASEADFLLFLLVVASDVPAAVPEDAG